MDVRSTGGLLQGTLAAQGFDAVTAERPVSKEVVMSDRESMSGLTPDEAREFHDFYMKGLVLFTAVAIVAHFMVWIWRPWLSSENMASASDLLQNSTTTLMTLIG